MIEALFTVMGGMRKMGWSGMKGAAKGAINKFGGTGASGYDSSVARQALSQFKGNSLANFVPDALSRSPKLFGMAAVGVGTMFANSGNEESPSLTRYAASGAMVLTGGALAGRGMSSLISGPMARKYVNSSVKRMGTGKVLPNFYRNAGIMKSFGSNEGRQYMFAGGALVSGLAFNSMFSTGKTQNHAYNRGSGNKIR